MKTLNTSLRLPSTLALAGLVAACGSGTDPSQTNNAAEPLQVSATGKEPTAQKPAVADGVYQIKNACPGEMVLDVNGSGMDQGSSLIVFPSHGEKNQQFKVEAQSDGTAKITAMHSNFVLDVYENLNDYGTKIIQWVWKGTDNQRWNIEALANTSGLYQIKSKASGLALDADKPNGTNLAAGAKVQQWGAVPTSCNQQWRFVAVGSASPAPAPAPAPSATPAPTTVELISSTYQKFDGAMLNPERGFHQSVAMVTSDQWGGPSGNGSYESVRNSGDTLVRGVALLEKHRNGPLPDSVLSELRQSFAHARNNSLKVWFLAAYNFPNGSTYETQAYDPELEVVLNHLDQLKPVFEENKDVIAGMYNGFFGAWGEQHSSTTGLHQDPKRRQIWEKMLRSIPPELMVTLRMFEAMDTLVGTHPTQDNAYDQNWGTRTGMTNQCFLVNYTDAGTFASKDQVAAQKAQLAKWTQFVPFIAEVCEVSYTEGNRHDCASAKAESEMLHLTSLNATFYKPTLDKWKADGCYNEINNRMGYRFELKNSGVQKSTKAGEAMQVNFVVKNVGYAAPHNPRDLAVVLRNQSTKETYRINIGSSRNATLDPRMWYRESGDISVNAKPILPASMAAGTYDVFLQLNDPHANLRNNPKYSIRLANKDTWEESTGLNLLVKGVSVTK